VLTVAVGPRWPPPAYSDLLHRLAPRLGSFPHLNALMGDQGQADGTHRVSPEAESASRLYDIRASRWMPSLVSCHRTREIV
jgi:hypothetical protein